MTDRRKHVRTKITAYVEEMHTGGEWELKGINVSAGGAWFRTQTGHHVGGEVDLMIIHECFPRDVRVRGRVIRVRPTADSYEVAVQFTEVDSNSMELLKDLAMLCGTVS